MKFMTNERATLDAILPGLDQDLESTPLLDCERPGGPGLDLFRKAGGPGLLVPREHGGRGASPLEAIRVQRAVGSRSASLAIATTMHHFSVASLVEISEQAKGFEWMLLEGIARDARLMASGFAEGRTGQSILAPTMQARASGSDYLISGSKKPCSLSRSMDLLTASVEVAAEDGDGVELAVALIPASDDQVECRPFWRSDILAGAESDEVIVSDVVIPQDLLVRTGSSPGDDLGKVQLRGFLWFELLMTASYLGVASALAERAITGERGTTGERAALGIELEATMTALEGLARVMGDGGEDSEAFAKALWVRYAAQAAIRRVTGSAVELLGGMEFIASPEVAYLSSAAQALAFHPPGLGRMHDQLADLLRGGSLAVA